MSGIVGAVLGGATGLSAVLITSTWRENKRIRLIDRVGPYSRDVAWLPRRPTPMRALHTRLITTLDGTLGGSHSVELRLDRLNSGTLAGFRAQQLVWGLAAFAVCLAVSLWLSLNWQPAVPALAVACLVGFIGGILACDNHLSSRVRKREQLMSAELPVIADLLALTVAAGEGPVAGLERTVRVSNGELSKELRRLLAEIRSGSPVAEAFDALSTRTGLVAVARFCDAISVALQRGSPLTDVLNAQVADVRDASRRDLIEAGARKEIFMMLPVVFLLMPVTVVFAFYPGLIALHLGT